MHDRLVHVNHLNETLDFYKLGILVDDNDLRDFEWSVSTANDKITGFTKGVVTKTIPLVFNVSRVNAEEIKNKFYEHFEKDILSVEPGYFELNGYRYYCYLTKSVKANYNKRKQYLELSITVSSDDPYWIKETTKTINFEDVSENSGLRYPFKYSFTYTGLNSTNVVNGNFVESDVIIKIYGACVNPLLKIEDNVYQVDVELDSFEYLEINTSKRTITKFSKYGDTSNLFDKRNKTYDVFKSIPSGRLTISANGKFTVDIVMFERRGEPKWI